jgi:two-component system response regulator
MVLRGERLVPHRILLVEDNPADAELTRDALHGSRSDARVYVIGDGEDALDYLHRRGPHAAVESPDLVLLDLNLPKVKGCEILANMRANNSLRQIPVIVLTSSADEDEVDRLYRLGANCFLTKPIDHRKFVAMMDCVVEFWLGTATLPAPR